MRKRQIQMDSTLFQRLAFEVLEKTDTPIVVQVAKKYAYDSNDTLEKVPLLRATTPWRRVPFFAMAPSKRILFFALLA